MADDHRAVPRRAAALLACALLLGCAAGSGAGGGSGGGTSGASGRDRFDGRYEGTRLPSVAADAASACRARARAVRFEVRNGIVEMRTNRRAGDKRAADLWGAVSTDGQVSMRPTSGKRTVAGRIEGDRLTAADTQEGQTVAQNVAAGGRAPCLYRYEATRVTGRSTVRGGGDGADAPPVEGVPQP